MSRLKDLREDNDLLQKDVAKILNVKKDTYYNWEHDLVVPPLNKIDQLALFYKVSLSYLLGLNNDYKKVSLRPVNYSIMLKKLKTLKAENKHTFVDLSNYLDCDRSTCQRYLSGNIKISLDKIILLADFYSIDLDYLCGKSN